MRFKLFLGIAIVLFVLVVQDRVLVFSRTPNVDSFFIEKNEKLSDNNLHLSYKISGIKGNSKFSIGLYISRDAEKNFKKVDFSSNRLQGISNIELKVEEAGYYYFMLQVNSSKKTIKKIYSKPIYLESSIKEYVEGIEANFIEDRLRIKWNKRQNEKYEVIVYRTDDLTKISEVVTENSEVSLDIPENEKKISVSVAILREKIGGNFYLVNVQNRDEPRAMVNFISKEATNKQEIEVSTLFMEDTKLSIILNNKYIVENSKRAGKYLITLDEGINEIKVIFRTDGGNVKSFKKIVELDTTPPKIILDSIIDNAVTSNDTTEIIGSVKDGIELSLNGKHIELIENKFFVNHPLDIGENDIKLVATDRVGNKTTIRAVITREREHKRNMTAAMVVGGTFSIIFLAYIVTFIGWLKKKRGVDKNNYHN